MEKISLAELLSKEMDRRDFFLHCVVILLSLTGVSNMLKVIEQTGKTPVEQPSTSPSSAASGYGV